MRVVLALCLLGPAFGCFAQSTHYYKSVHDDGAVAYSDTKPRSASSVEQVNVQQGGAGTEQQGQQRLDELSAASKRLDEEKARDAESRSKYQSRLAQARQEVADAERHLSTTRQSKHNATPERIDTAEERVRLARMKLKEVQSAAP
jgi:hypothetical protein